LGQVTHYLHIFVSAEAVEMATSSRRHVAGSCPMRRCRICVRKPGRPLPSACAGCVPGIGTP